jgi:Flp pilus assembly protein TadG
MVHFTANKLHRQRGIAAVEAAIVLPLLLLLFIATAEVGRALLHYNTLAKGVRDGARYLSTNAVDDFTSTITISPETETRTKNLARYGNIHGTGNALLPDYDDDDLSIAIPDPEHVNLTANYSFQPVLFNTLPTFGYGDGVNMLFTMQASVTMRAMQK